MNIEDIREYCISKSDSIETTPFTENILVYKVGTSEHAKMFALMDMLSSNYLIIKCDPDKAVELRERYPEIEGAFHMNKRHWNGVFIDGNLSSKMIFSMIDDSYNLVYNTLPKKIISQLTEK